LGLATNVVLVVLTGRSFQRSLNPGVEVEFSAGRIWWTRRGLANVPDLHSSIDTVYNAAISIMYVVRSSTRAEWCPLLAGTHLERSLESGSIYCFSAFLLAIALTTAGSSSELYSMLLGIGYQAIVRH
jgi:hypothetical protein